MYSIKVLSENGMTRYVSHGERETCLFVTGAYEEGDRIVLEYEGDPVYVWFQADEAMGASLIYLTGNYELKIPFSEGRKAYSPKAFSGDRHYLFVREALKEEIWSRRNQAINVCDHHDNKTAYPHASANVETRNESVFAARNAIDGIKANESHGEWPYSSWGINRDPDAKIKIEFGTAVLADEIVIYLRADFPHDSYFTEATLEFSDKSTICLRFEKTGEAQSFKFEPRETSYILIKDLKKADDPSPFPAITQIELYGVRKQERSIAKAPDPHSGKGKE
ncbi:MAG: carbohydrate-binding protein [Lachnospiraceae bacterium]|nr:carbohydrate-binding protein [Lachnospiraceae bacterium]